ncbi:MAG: hypothetical protein RLZZ440_1693 [Planctomycetota bacterium]
MKSLEVRVPHTLGQAEARRRLDAAVQRAQTDFGDKMSEFEAAWKGEDQMQVFVVVMGMKFDGEVDVLAEELVVRLQVPGMAGLFAGKIRSGIEERLGGLLTAAT